MSLDVPAIPGLANAGLGIKELRKTKQFDGSSFCGQVVRHHGVAVYRNHEEIECFWSSKDADAWIMHMYGGDTPSETMEKHGLTIVKLSDRQPKPGDPVWVDPNSYYYDVLISLDGEWGVVYQESGEIGICLNPRAVYCDGNSVSAMGGTSFETSLSSFHLAGLRRQRFWRWHKGHVLNDGAGRYEVTRPMWFWVDPIQR